MLPPTALIKQCTELTNAYKAQITALSPMMVAMSKASKSASASSSSKGGKRNGKKKKTTLLATDGAVIASFFNPVAGRPYPRFDRLDQTIRVVDTFSIINFLTASSTAPVGVGQYFSLAQFPSYTEYTQCFDQYRIDQLEVWMEPNGSQEAVNGVLVTAIDLDDVATPAGPTSIQDKQGALVADGNQGRYHRFLPHVAVAEYSGTFTSYGNVPATWIDSVSINVQHYGFKAATGIQTNPLGYNLTCRAVISFRAPGI
jgi:hypothetical protein